MQQLVTGREDIGLSLYADFITVEEEAALIATLNNTERKKQLKTSGRSSVQRFGSNIPYNSFMQAKYVPDYLDNYSERLLAHNLLLTKPDSVSINEYERGQTIQPHVDSKNSGAIITVLSLESAAIMRFDREKLTFDVELPKRSLVQMRGEIRDIWLHSILPVPGHRYSVVFRCTGK
jgi:alkylated DNA repair dioxygenase AlkB